MKNLQRGLFVSFLILHAATSALADGRLVDQTQVGTLTSDQLTAARAQRGLKDAMGPALNGVEFRKIHYQTSDGQGGQTTASGLAIVPTGATDQTPLVAFQHGTRVLRKDVPSAGSASSDALLLALTFAGQGFVVTSADYLGLGDNDGVHPYLDAATEASAGIELVEAVQEGANSVGHGHVYISGYSQGGQAAMAMFRELETHPRANIHVQAAAPAAGPYDLDGATINAALSSTPTTAASAFLGYMLAGLTRTNPAVFSDLSAFTADGVGAQIHTLYDGNTAFDTILSTLPPTPRGMLKTRVISDVEARDPSSPLFQFLRSNETFRWVPHHPVMLLHASGDHYVPFQNSMVAHDYFVSHGANSTLVDLGATLDHIEASVPACIKATFWFKSFEQP